MIKGLAAGLALIATCLMFPTASWSQATPNIFVDLSVLNDGGRGFGIAGGGNLAMPPRTAPISTLHVAPKSKVKLRAPMSKSQMAKTAAKKPAKKMAMKKAAPKPAATKKAPAPKKMAKAMQKPVAPKPAAAPAPPKAPKAAVQVAAPPPPPAAAPTTAGAAPPPPPSVSTTPPTAPAPSVSPPATESASAPMKFEVKPGRALRIGFGEAETKLPDTDKANLLILATAVRDKKDFRLQLLAYAGGKDLSTSKARRMSLSRALSVRSFLIDNGIRSTQIDVRALGNKTTEKPVNRVDLNLARR